MNCNSAMREDKSSGSLVMLSRMLLMSERIHCLFSSSMFFPICFMALFRAFFASSEVNVVALSLVSANLNFFPLMSASIFFCCSFSFSFCFSLSSSTFLSLSSFSFSLTPFSGFFFIQYFLLIMGSLEFKGLISSSSELSLSLQATLESSSSSSSSLSSWGLKEGFLVFLGLSQSSDSYFLSLNAWISASKSFQYFFILCLSLVNSLPLMTFNLLLPSKVFTCSINCITNFMQKLGYPSFSIRFFDLSNSLVNSWQLLLT